MKKEEITLKNTKAEILDALNKALEREKNLNKIKSNPVEEEKNKEKEKIVEKSRENVKQNIFSQELIDKFNDLDSVINILEDKLKNLYGIEKELNNITLVVNASKDCIADIENRKALKEDELKESIEALEQEYKLKKAMLEQEYETKAKELKTVRDREIEEYNYKLKRDREISNNKWEDEKKLRENKLKELEIETKRIFDEAKEKETYIHDLEKKVEELPTVLEKEYARGRKDATTEIEKEYKYKNELMSKDYQNTIDRQNDKIASLNEEINKYIENNKYLQEKMDIAYKEMKELATKTVEANGGVKILNNSESKNS